MSGDDDRAAFETASKPADANTAEFAPIAKMAASVDTLDGFLREMKTRFPDATARATLPPEIPKADPVPTGSLPDDRRIEAGASGEVARRLRNCERFPAKWIPVRVKKRVKMSSSLRNHPLDSGLSKRQPAPS